MPVLKWLAAKCDATERDCYVKKIAEVIKIIQLWIVCGIKIKLVINEFKFKNTQWRNLNETVVENNKID